jgi:hypothetical protein
MNGRKDKDHLKGHWLLVFLVASLYLLLVHPTIIFPTSSTLGKDLLMSQSHSTVLEVPVPVLPLPIPSYHHLLYSIYCSTLKVEAKSSFKI